MYEKADRADYKRRYDEYVSDGREFLDVAEQLDLQDWRRSGLVDKGKECLMQAHQLNYEYFTIYRDSLSPDSHFMRGPELDPPQADAAQLTQDELERWVSEHMEKYYPHLLTDGEEPQTQALDP